MAIQTQGLVSNASRLSQLLGNQERRAQRTNMVFVVALVTILGAFFAVNYFLVQRRALRGIAKLQAGAAVIGSGRLDLRIDEKRTDEIGDLARAFNKMTSDLKAVTASRADLEKEVGERKAAQKRGRRQNAIQEAINRILGEAMTSPTEAALGQTCLAVAEQLTQSKFGFLGEINSQGSLDDIAISDPGWDACHMADTAGHGKRPPAGFRVHGLYGLPIQRGKAFYTNEPASHPDRIGLPEGHPEVTAFLGVPLRRGDQTMGILALANREGGYRDEHLKAAEALAPAIMEALMRKRAEEALANHAKSLESLSVSATRLLGPMSSADLFRYLAGQLRAAAGDALVVISQYDVEKKVTIVRAVVGPEPKLRTLNAILGRSPIGLAFALDETLRRRMMAGALASLDGELHDLTFSQVPQPLSERLQEELHLGKVYAMAFLHEDDFMGTVAILTDEQEGLKNQQLIESLASQGALALRRRQAEDQIEEQLGMLEQAQVLVRDTDGRIVFWNQGAEKLYGYSKQEAVGRLSHDLLKTVFSVPRQQVEADLEQKGGWQGELIQLRRDGARVIISSNWTLLRRDSNHPPLIIEANSDITEMKDLEAALRATEQNYRRIVETAGEGILMTGADTRVTFVNARMADMLGYSREEIIGRPGEDFMVEDQETLILGTRERLHRGMQTQEEFRFRRKDGSVLSTLCCTTPIFDEGGTMVSFLSMFSDITERKRAEEELKRANAELVASNRELEAFSYSVSHDLRAPLRRMEGFSNALLEDYAGKLDDQGRQYLRYVQEASDLMARLIDDLLDLSRVTRTDMSYETVDLSELAQGVAAQLQKGEPQRKGTFAITTAITTQGDRNLLRLALENLLGNAWKFTGKAGAARIEVGAGERNGRQVFFVRDNGVGFDMAYADKLFQPFQRLHKSTDFTGSGIGLATVQRIVRRHGGEIWAEARVGEGATFYFTLG